MTLEDIAPYVNISYVTLRTLIRGAKLEKLSNNKYLLLDILYIVFEWLRYRSDFMLYKITEKWDDNLREIYYDFIVKNQSV